MLRVGATGREAAADSGVSGGAGRPVESPAPGVSGRGPLGPPSRTPTRARARPPAPPGPSFVPTPGLRAEVGRRWTRAASVALREALHGKRSRPSLARELRG